MTDPKPYIKWFSRCLFLILAALMSYVLFQPQYNFAHWVPHDSLRTLGVPYSAVLYFESNADKLLHPLGAFVLTVLLISSRLSIGSGLFTGSRLPTRSGLSIISTPERRSFWLLCTAMLVAEVIQWELGRGFEISDLLLGISGSYCGYKLIHRKE